MKGRRSLGFAVLLAALVGTLAFIAGSRVSSPASRAAEARPPDPSVLTTRAERRVVRDVVSVEGVVTASATIDVNPTGPEGTTPVVTRAGLNRGDVVVEGDVLVVVADRPVLVLGGDVPTYRDLVPGSAGTDVEQLHDALGRLGLSLGNDDRGQFGVGTQAAVRRLYLERGFEAPLTSPTAETEVARADDVVADAIANATAARETGDAERVGAADAALREARDRARSIAATTGAMVPQRELVFVPGLPATVTASRAVLGERTSPSAEAGAGSSPLLTIGAGSTQVALRLRDVDLGRVLVGQSVVVVLSNGDEVAGLVKQVSDRPSELSEGETTYPAVVAVPVSASQIGRRVRVDVVVGSSSGPVLAVPLAAVWADASGDRSVTRLVGGVAHAIPVAVGRIGGGWAEISPSLEISPSDLTEGDEVILASAAP